MKREVNIRFTDIAHQRAESRFIESVPSSSVRLIGTDEGDVNKYRSMYGGTRDLSPMKFSDARKLSLVTYQRNPLLGRIISLIMEFVLGDEFKIVINKMQQTKDGWQVVDEEEGQNVWDAFCNDSINNFYKRLNDFWLEDMLIGELLIPTTVNPLSGKILLGFVTTDLIEKVILDKTGLQVESLEMKSGSPSPRYDVVRTDYRTDQLVGDTIFYQSNKMLGQDRGYPEVMNLIDWLDMLDGMMWNALVHARFMNANVLDISLEGASDDEVKLYARDHGLPPAAGSVSIHNDKVKKEFLSPDIKAANTVEMVRLIKNFILASKSLPEQWFSDGGNTNLATAQEMSVPTMKMLKAQQTKVKEFCSIIVNYVLAKSKQLPLKENERWEIEYQMYDIERRDASQVGAGFNQAINALVIATSNNWLTNDKAKQVVNTFIHHLGIEPDEKTTDEIREENQMEEANKIYGEE